MMEPVGTFREYDFILRVNTAHDCLLVRPCKFGSERCVPGGGGSHGRGYVRMFWILRRGGLAVQFGLSTGWSLTETEEWQDARPSSPRSFGGGYHHPYKPMAFDLGYHSIDPMYDGQMEMKCDLLTSDKCYYDGSGLAAEEPWRIFRAEGQEAMLDHLAAYWEELVVRKVAPSA